MSRDGAIIGMACLFPGAPDLHTFWANIERGVDAITDVPPNRWPPVYYDPDSDAADRFYCRRGGFIDEYAQFDPLAWGIMPVAAQGAEPDQLLVLDVAAAALADAGYDDRPFPRERTGVVLGRGAYIGAGMTRLSLHVRSAEQLVQSLRTLVPGVTAEQLAAVKEDFTRRIGVYGPDTAIGLVPNLAASRLANRLDLQGPAYTLDAACASSLLAVDQACRDLRDGRSDLVLCGGIHLVHDVSFYSVFCQLGALSRTDRIRPFHRAADGLLIGEGIGVVVLKRLEDAERDGDRIYAVVRGTGVASDGRAASIMNPRVDGQVLAVRRAWEAAWLDPTTVGLIEAHGTATPVGDAAELATLRRVFGPTTGHRAGLGSVKSMIGHAMPAAGIAGLIKAALAVHHSLLPPTLHCDQPNPLLDETRFRILSETEPWPRRTGEPLRAGVNAFGFGGINAHVVLESHGESHARRPRSDPRFLFLAAPDAEALLAALELPDPPRGRGPARLAIEDPTPERRALARTVVERGQARDGRGGIWFSPRGLVTQGGKVAFLFPGVEAVYEPRVADVAAWFGREVPPFLQPEDLEQHGVAIIGLARLLDGVLREIGIAPDAIAGHSIGEWSGMIATGMLGEADVDAFLETLMPGTLNVPGVVFAAAGCGAEKAAAALEGLEDIAISHDNCPHQIILCGREDSVDEALRRLAAARVLGQKLPFRSGFHSPLFASYVAPHVGHIEELPLRPPDRPLWSATTAATYPADPAAVRALFAEHLVRPVRFRALIEALWADGVRVFVQVGVGSLVGFVDDTLRGRDHVAVRANTSQRSGMAQLRRLAATLFVEGADPDLDRLQPASPRKRTGQPLRLELGVPLVEVGTTLGELGPAPVRRPTGGHPVLAAFDQAMTDLRAAQETVVAAWETRPRRPTGPTSATVRRPLSVGSAPWLMDHCFFPQPDGWPTISDRFPVVPMTMSIEMMLAAAARVAGGLLPVAIEGVRAYRWLEVEPPTEAEISVRRVDAERVKVSIPGNIEGTVRLAPRWPSAPAPSAWELGPEQPAPFDAGHMYADRWMFHGPEYQTVHSLDGLAQHGIRGTLIQKRAEGALLDGAGQLFGFWIMRNVTRDRVAMPVKIATLELFGPPPPLGTRLPCAVHIRSLGAREVTADLELVRDGRVWCRIAGWTDWRFESDPELWEVIRHPEHNVMSEMLPDGVARVTRVSSAGAGRDFLVGRYLTERERATYRALPDAQQRAWLSGRIAAKDAVRKLLWARGHGPLFPAEVEVVSGGRRPTVSGAFDEDVRISIAHKDMGGRGCVAVAIAREGRDVGIDIETVEPRGDRFVKVAFDDAEVALIPSADRDEWLTRIWCAKEAVGKRRGTGLEGRPRDLVVTGIDGERLRVADTWVCTARQGDDVIGWTVE